MSIIVIILILIFVLIWAFLYSPAAPKSFYMYNIESETINNESYRRVLNTTPNQQLVLMNILPHEEIGNEVHPTTTQFIRVESGKGKAIINNQEEYILNKDSAITISPNTYHNIINDGDTPLKLYTIYSPPEHKPNLIQEKNVR